MLRLFPEYLKGEELFGLTVHAVLRIAESVGARAGLGWGGEGGGSPIGKGRAAGRAGGVVVLFDLPSAPSPAAARCGELPELPVPLRSPSAHGAAADDQPHRLRPRRAQDPHPLQTVSGAALLPSHGSLGAGGGTPHF